MHAYPINADVAQVGDTGVFALQVLTGLQRLTLAGCSRIGNGPVGALAKITSLQHLDLQWCSFGDKGEHGSMYLSEPERGR